MAEERHESIGMWPVVNWPHLKKFIKGITLDSSCLFMIEIFISKVIHPFNPDKMQT